MIKRYLNKKAVCMFLSLSFIGIVCCFSIFFGGLLALLLVTDLLVFYVYHSKVPNIFRMSKRDYDSLIIGSRNVGKSTKEDLLCVSFDRSLQMNRLILERMYSFLRKGGNIIFHINLYKDRIKGINPSDIYYLHGVTVSELGIKFPKFRYFFPLLVNPLYAFNYLIWVLCDDGIRRKKENAISDITEWIVSAESFCKEREIQVVFRLYGKREDITLIREKTGVEVKDIFEVEN